LRRRGVQQIAQAFKLVVGGEVDNDLAASLGSGANLDLRPQHAA
jgi:hypothetical protein